MICSITNQQQELRTISRWRSGKKSMSDPSDSQCGNNTSPGHPLLLLGVVDRRDSRVSMSLIGRRLWPGSCHYGYINQILLACYKCGDTVLCIINFLDVRIETFWIFQTTLVKIFHSISLTFTISILSPGWTGAVGIIRIWCGCLPQFRTNMLKFPCLWWRILE